MCESCANREIHAADPPGYDFRSRPEILADLEGALAAVRDALDRLNNADQGTRGIGRSEFEGAREILQSLLGLDDGSD